MKYSSHRSATLFQPATTSLKKKYGSHLKDLIPTEQSRLYLYGDKMSTPELVGRKSAHVVFMTAYGALAPGLGVTAEWREMPVASPERTARSSSGLSANS